MTPKPRSPTRGTARRLRGSGHQPRRPPRRTRTRLIAKPAWGAVPELLRVGKPGRLATEPAHIRPAPRMDVLRHPSRDELVNRRQRKNRQARSPKVRRPPRRSPAVIATVHLACWRVRGAFARARADLLCRAGGCCPGGLTAPPRPVR